jgi:hypothetical protein
MRRELQNNQVKYTFIRSKMAVYLGRKGNLKMLRLGEESPRTFKANHRNICSLDNEDKHGNHGNLSNQTNKYT